MRLIDADALKQNIAEWQVSESPTEGWNWRMERTVTDHERQYEKYLTIGQMNDVIDEQPTVDAEPVRHGEWVKMRGMMPPEYMGLKECSVCGWHINPIGRTAFDKHESEFCYCPHCGARMDEQFADPRKMLGDEDAID